jgi:hypothetical protein
MTAKLRRTRKRTAKGRSLKRVVSRKLRKQCDGLYVAGDEDTITDGYAEWSAWCCMCGNKTMQIVRPGKVHCTNCG